MGTMRERQREVQLYRGQVPSPGRPTVAWREDRVRFWAAVSRGLKTEGCGRRGGCLVAGCVPMVPPRWRRESLSFSNGVGSLPVVRRAGGDRAPPRSGSWCAGDCAAATTEPVDDLAGAAPERVDADVAARIQAIDRAVACRAPCPPAEGRQAGRERPAPRVRPGTAVRSSARCRRSSSRAAGTEVERAEQAAPRRSPLGAGLEPGANREPAAGRVPR